MSNVFYRPRAGERRAVCQVNRLFCAISIGFFVANRSAFLWQINRLFCARKREAGAPAGRKAGGGKAERGWKTGLNFNVFNLRKQTAGCFGEAEKDLRKIIRHLEKTTKHLEKITKPAEKITKHLVTPSPGLFFGRKGQKETGEALHEQEVLGLALQRYNIFQRKANRPNCILTLFPLWGN